MDTDQFWRLIESTRGEADRAEALAGLLEPLDADAIVRFRILYDDLINSANTVDLRAAAHVINGDSTDDQFYYFRTALVERGRETFEAAIAAADSLADVATPGEKIEGTDVGGIAPIVAWTAKTGGTEDAFFEALDRADDGGTRDDVEEGEWWNFNKITEVRERLPRLAEKFLSRTED